MIDFSRFDTPDSKFTAELIDSDAYVVFSNSGKNKSKKFFNHSKFIGNINGKENKNNQKNQEKIFI